MHVIAADGLRLDMDMGDYFVLAIVLPRRPRHRLRGAARRGQQPGLLPLRAVIPAWVTGLAFISANLGAIELLGMAANGAQYGLPTLH